MTRCAPTPLAWLLALATVARADVAGDLQQAQAALARRDAVAATSACRRALEAADATAEQRRQALDALLAAALEAEGLTDHADYLDRRRAAAPDDQRRLLLAERLRCQKAADGHFHGALAQLEALDDEKARHEVRHLRRDLLSLCAQLGQLGARQAADARRLSVRPARTAPPRRPPRSRSSRRLTVPQPTQTRYSPTRSRIAPTRPRRVRRSGRRFIVPVPRAPRYYVTRPLSVRKPALLRRGRDHLAAVFLSRFYQRSSRLAAQGFYESAKAELATVMQLFPNTSQAAQAAQYAVRLFQRERRVAGPAQASALVAYLRWIRAVVGPEGSEYAEYLALRSFASDSDPTIVAREAEGFLKRHPESKWVEGVRLQLAVSLDTLGDSARAIEVLTPVATPLDSAAHVKAARILAWLHLFQGQAEKARGLFQALAAQTVSPQDAAQAARLLKQMAALPPEKGRLPIPEDPEETDEMLAERLFEAGNRVLADADPERAMDVFALYLHVARRSAGYWAARQRIERLKQKGQVAEE